MWESHSKLPGSFLSLDKARSMPLTAFMHFSAVLEIWVILISSSMARLVFEFGICKTMEQHLCWRALWLCITMRRANLLFCKCPAFRQGYFHNLTTIVVTCNSFNLGFRSYSSDLLSHCQFVRQSLGTYGSALYWMLHSYHRSIPQKNQLHEYLLYRRAAFHLSFSPLLAQFVLF